MTKEGTQWQSVAQWPNTVSLGTSNNESHDNHPTEAAALAVVNRLKREGFGGEGKVFPIKAYVLPPTPPTPAGAGTETPRTEQVARNIGKLLAEYKHGPLGLADTANLIDDALNGSRAIERELTSLRRQAEYDSKTMSTIEQLKARRDELNRELMSLHIKIIANEQEAAPESIFFINGKKVVRKSPVCGTHVRMELSPQTAGYPLFFENTGHNPDIQINDSDPIPNGARLYSVPPAINGG